MLGASNIAPAAEAGNPGVRSRKINFYPWDRASFSPIVLMGVPFDAVTTDEAVALIEKMIASGRPHHVVTANVDFLVKALSDFELHRILLDAHLVLCDGMPLVWASRWMGNPLPERVAGSDLVPLLMKAAAQRGYRVFLLGATLESNEQAAKNLRALYPSLIVAGHYSPPFAPLLEMDHAEIRCQIQQARPDLLLVSLGCPKQEKWIAMHYRSLGVPVCIGVGATIDFLAGRSRRAPRWMQHCGMEWIFRALQEPSRLLGRYARDLAVFSRAMLIQWFEMRRQEQSRSRKQCPILTTGRDWTRIKLPGRLDGETARLYGRAWQRGLARRRRCFLDLSGVEFIDSTGMGLLVRLQKRARSEGRGFVLLRPGEAVQSALEFMRLKELFLIAPTFEEALKLTAESRAGFAPREPSICWEGELTAANVDRVWNAVEFLTRTRQGTQICIDVSRLIFIDSAGVCLMLRAKKKAALMGANLVFTGIQPGVENILRMAKVESVLLDSRGLEGGTA